MRNDQQDTQGISNRETFSEEQQERMEHPPMSPDAPPVEQDAAGDEGEDDPVWHRHSDQVGCRLERHGGGKDRE
jgi:hypothetical protein